MTGNVFELTHNYRVKSELFTKLLPLPMRGEPTHEDAQNIMDLHPVHHDREFIKAIKDDPQTM